MSTNHENITSDSLLHEAKGVSSATDGQVLTAASGVNSFAFVPEWFTWELDDISTASSTWLPAPYDGTVTDIKSILHGAIATADDTITMEINGVAVTGVSMTVAYSGSAAGDVDTDTATALNTFSENDKLEFITTGASTNTVRLTIMAKLQRTA